MNTNHAGGWGFKITYPLFKDVSLNYWLRLLEKGQSFTSEKLHLQFTEASRAMWALSTSDLPWGFPAAWTVPLQGRQEGRSKGSSSHYRKKRKKNSLKVMPFPLVDSGRGGICNHSFGWINIHLSLLQVLPRCFCLWHWDLSVLPESPVQRKVINHFAPQDTLPLSRSAPHYLKDAHELSEFTHA